VKNYVGYLVRHKDGLYGERGLFYDYVLAENGVFIETEGPLLAARVPVASANIRGLAPLDPKVVLRHGPIPKQHFDLALSAMLTDTKLERYLAVIWNDGYHLRVPEQAADKEQLLEGGDDGHGSGGGVAYLTPDKVILDLHSHGEMAAWFSTTDNKDELGFKLFGVVGKLNKVPQLQLRVGVYGYFHPLIWEDIFEGFPDGLIDDLVDEPTEEEIEMKTGAEPYLKEHIHNINEEIRHTFFGHRPGVLDFLNIGRKRKKGGDNQR